jgi:hypothetical protein
VGDGVYKSTDGGKTWTHLGLRDTQMIANIDVDPTNPNRLFRRRPRSSLRPQLRSAVSSAPPMAAPAFEKVLFKDDYTSGNDVRIDPKNPNIVYAALWQQQQGFYENGAFGGAGGGIFKSTDGGSTGRSSPPACRPSSKPTSPLLPATPRSFTRWWPQSPGPGRRRWRTRRPRRPRRAGGRHHFYKTTDGGENWFAGDRRSAPPRRARSAIRRGRWSASAAATCPPSRSTPRTRRGL